ncbi:unnamed protein product [Nippostrongylus brasiliensis]|uniref:Transmembrane protein n=1 Tax=Nippostrongylus brasiliensis TaxID=27835 RepID=A0A0N4XYD5_NIPBR|nr:unnamed protein product [Nippostrongylus brasiliensis]
MGCSTARSDPETPDIDQRTEVKMDSTDDEHCDNVQLGSSIDRTFAWTLSTCALVTSAAVQLTSLVRHALYRSMKFTARSDPDTPDIDQRTDVKMDSTDGEHCGNVQFVSHYYGSYHV